MAANEHTEDVNNVIKKINILLLSDIHCNKDGILKVKKYIDSSKITINHLWMPGDFMNLSEADNEDEKTIKDAENKLIDLLSTARLIHPKPVIIPGNHDPITLFKTDNDKYFNFGECVNIHKQLYAVEGENNLFMIGFGGSVPATCESKEIWSGYPYKNETEFAKEFIPFMENSKLSNNKNKKNECKEDNNDNNIVINTDKSVILFTHNGPLNSSTTMDWRETNVSKIIDTGSDSVTNIILNKDIRNKLICNIHGHTHLGVGQARIGHVPIINPGSLSGKNDGGHYCNNFAIMELTQFKDKTWMCTNVNFNTLTD